MSDHFKTHFHLLFLSRILKFFKMPPLLTGAVTFSSFKTPLRMLNSAILIRSRFASRTKELVTYSTSSLSNVRGYWQSCTLACQVLKQVLLLSSLGAHVNTEQHSVIRHTITNESCNAAVYSCSPINKAIVMYDGVGIVFITLRNFRADSAKSRVTRDARPLVLAALNGRPCLANGVYLIRRETCIAHWAK